MKHGYVLAAVAASLVIASLISPGHALMLALGLGAGPWLANRLRQVPDARPPVLGAEASGNDTGLYPLLDGVPLSIVTLDRAGSVISANTAALQHFPSLQTGRPLSFGIREPQVLDAVARVVAGGPHEEFRYVERGSMERHFLISAASTSVRLSSPDAPTTVLTIREISQERAVEATRADFVANASHELRTPLASVMGLIETLQGPAKADAAAREKFLDIMLAQARRMSRLVDDLLSLSRITLNEHNPPRAVLDIGELANQAVLALGEFARERGVELSLAQPAQSTMVTGDRDELASVLDNLIENAIKYGRSGKRVEISIDAAANPREIAVAVRDYGPGIAPEHVPRLTERFYRIDAVRSRSEGGTGLGLALVKHTINRHRGRLSIRSTPGEGSTFSFTLPRAEAATQTVINP